MNPRRYLKDRKGIQTILAALLMVVIVVVASVMVYAWSTGLLGTLLVNPNQNKEGPLSIDSSAFPGSNNVTLYIRNGGTLGVTLASYYITDSSGDTWQALTWSGPVISPNTVMITTIGIGATASTTTCNTGGSTTTTCSYVAGSGTFTSFTTGAYTIKVITTRNNPFSFTVSK